MKFQAIFGLLFLFVISVLAVPQHQRRPNGARCDNSGQCESRYCRRTCTEWGRIKDEKGLQNPCKERSCPEGEECQIQEVQCLRAPCPGVGGCEKVQRWW